MAFANLTEILNQIGSLTSDSAPQAQRVLDDVSDILAAILFDRGLIDDLDNIVLNTNQSRIMAAINAIVAGSQLIEERAPEVNPAYFRVAATKKMIADRLLRMLNTGFLDLAWIGYIVDPSSISIPLPTARPASRSIVFAGAGLNDLTSGGTYSGSNAATFVVAISSAGAPDSFTWTLNGGAVQGPVAITGGFQTLSSGFSIKFSSTTGHTPGDSWTITVTVHSTAQGVANRVTGLGTPDGNSTPTLSTIDTWIDWIVAILYGLASSRYDLSDVTNLSIREARLYGALVEELVSAMVAVTLSVERAQGEVDQVRAATGIRTALAKWDAWFAGAQDQIFIS